MARCYSQERRSRIVELIRERKKLTVHELCGLLDVSPATVRADLRDLDREGLLVRTHGGAIEKSRAGYEVICRERSAENLSAKQSIGQIARQYVADGDTILLDTGTTTVELAKLLRQRPLPRSDGGHERSGDCADPGGHGRCRGMLGGDGPQGLPLHRGPGRHSHGAGLARGYGVHGHEQPVTRRRINHTGPSAGRNQEGDGRDRARSFCCATAARSAESRSPGLPVLEQIDILILDQITEQDRATFEEQGIEVAVARAPSRTTH